ncbi:PL29 family lyase N-terminal domain-containing protein [Caecibacteroides pullorum]|uniref:DUF4988 domain-containing protein n=1 Tax=Caecibacteroides pullorum TaxID=2725562 RepID=A0AA41DAU6_9BACT|nr:PL29 family lyase N-terminal domain-containing protein [Caecibacteroides pullorum]MBM6857477.1 hypothetical protein [Caecibacteroides pullorum]MBV8039841.1 hypothetical protein [Caecibacteroides pullorum]MBV8058595.1 hypothetical protein [Caecibacteroides pullorum]MDC6280321.1 PL29 family lyase N-terminal domain-containing protein [Caecibacteroides pullorum]
MYKRTFMQTLAAVAMMLLPAACADDYDDSALWDKVNDHEERLAALEKWQEQTNQSIAAMQELLNTTDMITGVSAVTEDGQTVGYTITFLHSDPITIYNGAKGADGEDGADGADGQTPQIGLAQAEDGNWYWTLNGELLTDAQGNPIRANGLDGADGADGEDGEDGATGPEGPQGNDGTSAPTPQILLGSNIPASGNVQTDNGKAIDNAWYLSVDNGATWYRVSGKDGTNGDAWFSDEPQKEGNYYVFTLTDQSTFRVAAYQPFRILTEAEKDGTTFTNATVTINGATTFYLYIDNDIKYQEIVAQISSVDAVLTRADVSDWTVVKGTEQNTLTVTPGTQPYALLDVSLLLTDGSKLTASRLLEDPGYTDDGQGNYTVTSAEGLKNLAKLVNEEGKTDINITLDTDLTLTGEWTPIGTESQPYTGTFDGGNHTITGLKIDQSGTDNVGLIGRLGSGGKVQDVTLTEVNVTGGTYVGGIAGQTDGTVENCSVNGTVTGQNQTGGIVGRNFSTISGCSAEGTVTGNTNVGGISGLCVPNYDTGTGSLIGSTIEGCHSTAAVSGISSVGGVVGNLGNGCSLMACYSTGNVTATITYGHANVGGVVGINGQGTVTACYHATGEITSSVGDRIGGIAGCNDQGTFTACYWENNQEQGTGSGSTGGTAKVEGNVIWKTAVDAMNAALNGLTTWYYDLSNEGLPVLMQQP